MAEKTREEVEVQEADAGKMAAECQAIADDARADLGMLQDFEKLMVH